MKTRSCFCLLSKNPVPGAIQENHRTYLHTFWTKSHLYGEGTRLIPSRVLWSVGMFPVGILGYTAAVALRALVMIGNFFTWLMTLCCVSQTERKARGIIALDSLLAFSISLVGVVHPPLAYKLDGLATEHMLTFFPKE